MIDWYDFWIKSLTIIMGLKEGAVDKKGVQKY